MVTLFFRLLGLFTLLSAAFLPISLAAEEHDEHQHSTQISSPASAPTIATKTHAAHRHKEAFPKRGPGPIGDVVHDDSDGKQISKRRRGFILENGRALEAPQRGRTKIAPQREYGAESSR